MERLRLAISTQTPLVRFQPGEAAVRRRMAATVPMRGQSATTVAADEVEETGRLADHAISPGGVSRMVLQSVRAWREQHAAATVHWFSLQPHGPARLHLEDAGIHLHHLRLSPDEMGAYARTKERLWADIHGLHGTGSQFSIEDFRFYARYNHTASDAILAQLPDLDVAYVHDFQLLQVGAIVGLASPCVLRWHVPFDPKRIPSYTRSFLLRMMEAYDGVIVSTRRELEGLTNAGFHGRVHQVYPHSDPADFAAPPRAVADEFAHRIGIPDDVPVLVLVARMDPMKRQDLAIEALARMRDRTALLVLVGNGSFSGSRTAGLGLSKAETWRSHLEALARDLGVADRVRFTGWLPDAMVAAAYARADALVLPSDIEGFGLTPFEAWGHGKPCVISDGCGSAEVVQDGVSGIVVPAGDAQALAGAFDRLLSDRDAAERMGEAGRLTLHSHAAGPAAQAEAEFLRDAVSNYRRRTGW